MTRYDTAFRFTAAEALESRFGRGIAARLSERVEQASPDVAERLRFGREKALETARARRAAASTAVVGTSGGAAVLGGGWWFRFVSFLPLLALVGGLAFIVDSQVREQISTAAEVDAALLGDDLPITAYRDPGFVEYLKAPPGE